VFLAHWSTKKLQHVRYGVRELTARSRLLLPVDWVTEDSTGSCAAGLRTSGSTTPPTSSTRSTGMPGCGWRGSLPAVTDAAGDSGGSCSTMGATRRPCSISLEPWLPPDPSGTGGKGRMPAVNDVGEPCAGEPHARFDGRGLETEQET
jgi:hypothetical protein